VSLEARKAFAAALWDVPLAEAFVLLASTESAYALVREAPPLEELPDVITPWVRARAWATAHRDAPVAPPLSLGVLEEEVASATQRGLVLVDRTAIDSFLVEGSLARAFVFAPRGRKTKLRLDRVQSALVRSNGQWLGDRGATICDAALAVLGPEPMAFKEMLRRARESVRASTDDGKRVASALLHAWNTSDVELILRNP
jgi:hypothetical protein